MAIYYFDTSALLKRYILETGSSWVRATLDAPDTDVVISQLTLVEAVAALARRAKGGAFQPGDAQRVMERVESDCRRRFVVVAVAAPVIDGAVALARQYALRGYDALQLASALAVQTLAAPEPVTFVSADEEVNLVAASAGLAVADPTYL